MKTLSCLPKLVSLLALIFMCFSGKAQSCPIIHATALNSINFTFSVPFLSPISGVTITHPTKGTFVFNGAALSNATDTSVTIDLSSSTLDSADASSTIITTDGVTPRTCNITMSLPVTLMYFTVNKSSEGVLAKWRTAMEKNADIFQIERSSNGKVWETVATVKAAGNSDEINDYSQFVKSSDGFFRLKEIDCGGNFQTSEVITISSEAAEVKIFPNPANDIIYIEGNFFSIKITDLNGKLVFSQTEKAKSLSISELGQGSYFMIITDRFGKESYQKLRVLKM